VFFPQCHRPSFTPVVSYRSEGIAFQAYTCVIHNRI
jgi:hypothetical protein